MDERNRNLLKDLIEDRLERAIDADPNNEEDKLVFKEAMEAVNKQIELDKIETSHKEQIEKMKMDKEQSLRDETVKLEEAKKERLVQIGLFAAGLLISPIIEVACKKGYAKMLCEFEKDYTFTTSAGRSLSGLFRFKK